MQTRTQMLVISAAVAVMSLTLTLWFGRTTPRLGPGAIAPMDDQVPDLDVDRAPQAIPLAHARGISARGRDGRNQLIEFIAAHAEPTGPRLIRVKGPRVRIHRGAGLTIQIEADQGQVRVPQIELEAEQHQVGRIRDVPREGDLDGHVEVSFFKAPPGKRVDFSDRSPQLLLRIFLEEAHFDLDLNDIRSDGSVRLVGERVSFEGRGMHLVYNEIDSRIERLDVDEGEYLRFWSARHERDRRSAASRSTDEPLGNEPSTNDTQYYRARFDSQVMVKGAQLAAEAGQLEVLFGFGGAVGERDEGSPTATKPPPATSSDTDEMVTITWSGGLAIVPDARPDQGWAGPHDVRVSMLGGVIIDTNHDQHVRAERVTYQFGDDKIDAVGKPLVAESPELGHLQVDRLTIHGLAKTGQLIGPGEIQTPVETGQVLTDRRRLPPAMDIRWSGGVDLNLHQVDPPAIESIAFHGDVQIKHRSFDLTAQRLGIALTEKEQQVHTISASGAVSVATHGPPQEPPLSVEADQVTVDMAGNGASGPSRLRASGRVKVRQLDKRLEADQLEVAFTTDPPDPGEEDEQVQVHTMVARRSVRIKFTDEDQAFDVAADRVVANATKDHVELFGTSQSPVRIDRGDVQFVGTHVILEEANKKMTVKGPGTWRFRKARPGDHRDHETVLTVTWTDRMLYFNNQGRAQFFGTVVTSARRGQETTRLSADELTLDLSRVDGVETDAPFGTRQVRRVSALGQVRFIGTQWRDQPDGQVNTRLLIKGPKMVFSNDETDGMKVEEIRFVGAGNMLFEDYRPPESEGVALDAQVRLSGRGRTAFSWNGQFLIDALANNIRIDDGVLMLHQPMDGVDPVQIVAEHLEADVDPTGGLESWTGGQAPKPNIRTVTARQRVVVTLANTEIRTGRLAYDDADQYVTLTAESGGVTAVIADDNPYHYIDPIRWNVRTRQMELSRPGAMRVRVK